MRLDLQTLDLDLWHVPIEYDDRGLDEGRALRSRYRDVETSLRRDGVRPGTPTWTARVDAAKAPLTRHADYLDAEQARAWTRATARAEDRLQTLSRPPRTPVEDAALARLRDALAQADPAQRAGQLLYAARQYGAGQHTPDDEAVLRAALTGGPEVWGVAPLFDELTLRQAEAAIVLPEVGPDILRARLAARLRDELRAAIGLQPEPIRIQRPDGRRPGGPA
jgi:hypothetical protein